jgi:hypothetical protein
MQKPCASPARFVEPSRAVSRSAFSPVAIVVALGGLAGSSAAQPAPAPLPLAPPSPEAAPPPSAPSAPAPAPIAPPSLPAAPPSSATFGPPSQYEAPPPAPPQPQPALGGQLSESTAVSLSLGGTLVSYLVIVGGAASGSGEVAVAGVLGTLLAPSFGHWYRGAALTRGLGLRALGGVGLFLGVVSALGCEDGDCSSSGEYLAIGGAVLYLGGTLDDIVTASTEVRKHNQRAEVLGLAPIVTKHAAGLALGGRF